MSSKHDLETPDLEALGSEDDQDFFIDEVDDEEDLDYRTPAKQAPSASSQDDDDDDDDVDVRSATTDDDDEDDVEDTPAPKKKGVGNPYAALRQSERTNKILAERLNRVIETLNQPKPAPEPEEEEEEFDYSDNPIEGVRHDVGKIRKDIEKQKEELARQKQEEQVQDVMARADQGIEQFKNEIGKEEYAAAVQHLIDVQLEDMMEAFPQATAEELTGLIAQQAYEEKYRLQLSGKNPAKAFYNRAKRHGYKPKARQKQDDVEEPKAKRNAKEELERARARAAKSGTISKSRGAAPKVPSVDDFVGMSEDDFDDYVDSLARSKGRKASDLTIGAIIRSAK